MGRHRLAAFVALLLSAGLSAGPAQAARKRLPPPPVSITVDSARIEPLAAGAHVMVDGTGEYRGALELR
ncbi:MAG: hypothetical protein ACRDYV_14110, partial [Acidimicrobiia bacterium]